MQSEKVAPQNGPVRSILIAGQMGAAWCAIALALAQTGTRLALIHESADEDQAIETATRAAAKGATALPLLLASPDRFPDILQRTIEDLGRLDGVVLVSRSPTEWAEPAATALRRARPLGRLIAATTDNDALAQEWLEEIVRRAEAAATSRVRIATATAPDPEQLAAIVARAFEFGRVQPAVLKRDASNRGT